MHSATDILVLDVLLPSGIEIFESLKIENIELGKSLRKTIELTHKITERLQSDNSKEIKWATNLQLVTAFLSILTNAIVIWWLGVSIFRSFNLLNNNKIYSKRRYPPFCKILNHTYDLSNMCFVNAFAI